MCKIKCLDCEFCEYLPSGDYTDCGDEFFVISCGLDRCKDEGGRPRTDDTEHY